MLVVDWLLEGDISIQYLTYRDLLLNTPEHKVRAIKRRVGMEGWAKRLFDHYDPESGTWGGGWYSPQWIGTHYTLMSLMDLAVPGGHPIFKKAVGDLVRTLWANGGIRSKGSMLDLCVSAMLLKLMSYAGVQLDKAAEIVDYLLSRQFDDGGYNCHWDKGARRSSVHTSISVLETFSSYLSLERPHRADEIRASLPPAVDFLLRKQLFRSERDGTIFDEKITKLAYPVRWKYDILRALDYLARNDWPYDPRMDQALNLLISKQGKDGLWKNEMIYGNKVFFTMESRGKASRMNSYKTLYVLRKYRPKLYGSIYREDY